MGGENFSQYCFGGNAVGFIDLSLKQAYSSDFDLILDDFYIPVLENAIEYKRIAGFFSSTSLAVAARGIIGFIRNGGKMQLLISPILRKEDLDILMKVDQSVENIVEKMLLKDLENLEGEFTRDHVFALGWMIANERLQIKVVAPKKSFFKEGVQNGAEYSGLFHQKVGILKDSKSNIISFSGSVNETASGWLENVEEFKVFRSWEEKEKNYIQADISKFHTFWNNLSRRADVFEVPIAVRNRLISIAPKDIEDIDFEKHYKYLRRRQGRLELFGHQKDAVHAWLNNGMRGIFAMATGTGKTFTALGCLEEVTRKFEDKVLVIIACPYHHLINQWQKEIHRFNIKYDKLLIADSSNKNWRDEVVNTLIEIGLSQKEKVIILTTHNTFSSTDFISLIQKYKPTSKILFIADEVHGLGAKKSKSGFINEYDFRLGLSATPKRWFDSEGTDAIYKYFGGEIFNFGLYEAINTINPATGETYLVPYRYLPKFTFLNSQEMEAYIEKSQKIAKISGIKDNEIELRKYKEMLLFARANIIKNAQQKMNVFESILSELGLQFCWTIAYCSPQQIDNVMEILSRRRIIAHRFTMQEGIKPLSRFDGLSEREFLLNKFGEGSYQCLVAMKCLDEGVDIPPARTAILLSSSGNPLEYIQRIGRVIRRYPQKKQATIYDIIVLPSYKDLPANLKTIEKNIIRKELHRYKEIAQTAINNAQALAQIAEVLEKFTE